MAIIGEVLIMLGALILILVGIQQLFSISFGIPMTGSSIIPLGQFQGLVSLIMGGLIIFLLSSFHKISNPYLYSALVILLAVIGGHVGGLLAFIGAMLVAISYLLD